MNKLTVLGTCLVIIFLHCDKGYGDVIVDVDHCGSALQSYVKNGCQVVSADGSYGSMFTLLCPDNIDELVWIIKEWETNCSLMNTVGGWRSCMGNCCFKDLIVSADDYEMTKNELIQTFEDRCKDE